MSSISAPLPPASTPKFSILVSPAANSMIPSSAISRQVPTRAAKTANSTLSSSMVPFFNLPSPFEREKQSTAMALCFAIYCRKWRKQQNERRNLSKRKSALSHPARARPDSARRRPAHCATSVEFYPRRRHGPLLRCRHPRSPPRVYLSPARSFPRRHFHRLPQTNPHRLREFLNKRRHRSLAPRPPHHRSHQSRHASRRHPVFPRHQFRRLGPRQLLSAHRRRTRNLLHRRHSLLLEHPRR